MTNRPRVSVGAVPALLLAALYFFDSSGVFSAMLPAVLVHEAGHALALRLCGARFRQLRLEIGGFSLNYSGVLGRGAECLCALMGPAFGAVFALTASVLGRRLQSEFLLCAAGVSAALTAFNLLPAPMLDGGRVLGIFLPEKVMVVLGMATGCALLIAGLYCAVRGYGLALLPAGVWVTVCTCQWKSNGV
ncbi:MAG: site-2 protease family protein, partial [Firmicutes bacterium]|nr:site-2 protease family protein [Bacillota bacterium]